MSESGGCFGSVLSSDLALNGTPNSALLNGQVLIDRLSFTESFDLATLADEFTGPSSPPIGGIAQNIKLDVALKSAQEMGLSSSKLSLQGLAGLRVGGTIAEPVIRAASYSSMNEDTRCKAE